jgi:predicted transcriptional regulator of viral defense system
VEEIWGASDHLAWLSTDLRIVMDSGVLARVGFAPMDQIKLTAELLADGWSPAELDRLARSGELQRIRRGAYECGPARSLERRDQHRLLIQATLRQTSVDSAISHMSAAVLHQLPIWNDQLGRVHITRNQSGGGKVRRYVHLHVARCLKSTCVRSRVCE